MTKMKRDNKKIIPEFEFFFPKEWKVAKAKNSKNAILKIKNK